MFTQQVILEYLQGLPDEAYTPIEDIALQFAISVYDALGQGDLEDCEPKEIKNMLFDIENIVDHMLAIQAGKRVLSYSTDGSEAWGLQHQTMCEKIRDVEVFVPVVFPEDINPGQVLSLADLARILTGTYRTAVCGIWEHASGSGLLGEHVVSYVPLISESVRTTEAQRAALRERYGEPIHPEEYDWRTVYVPRPPERLWGEACAEEGVLAKLIAVQDVATVLAGIPRQGLLAALRGAMANRQLTA